MKRNHKVIILLLLSSIVLWKTACVNEKKKDNELTFDSSLWKKSNGINSGGVYIRERMERDLLLNYLKVGIHRDVVLRLLGNQINENPCCIYDWEKDMKELVKTKTYSLYGGRIFSMLNSKYFFSNPSLLLYTSGFSGSGPNLLVVVFDKNDNVVDVLKAIAI
jgi:hypothetical protein